MANHNSVTRNAFTDPARAESSRVIIASVRGSRRIFILIIAVCAAGVGYAWYPPLRLITWVAVGRSPDCPLTQALRSSRNQQIEKESNDRIVKQSRLISIDREGLELWQTPQGRFWIPGSQRKLLPFYLAAQERKIYGSGDAGPQSNDIALDWGANIGVTVNEELLAGAGEIIAVEPSPQNVECLRRNFSNEIAIGRVILYPSDPSTTVDKVVADLKLARLNYLKVDAAGGEPKALNGARDTIARFKPRISVTTYHPSSDPKIIEQAIHAIRPDYQVRCGPCVELKEAHTIRPDVLYFK